MCVYCVCCALQGLDPHVVDVLGTYLPHTPGTSSHGPLLSPGADCVIHVSAALHGYGITVSYSQVLGYQPSWRYWWQAGRRGARGGGGAGTREVGGGVGFTFFRV